MEAASDPIDSSSKWLRGWKALGRMCEIGTTRSRESDSPVASPGIRALRPLPSPLRRAIAHLLGQLAVGHGTPRGRIKRCDGLPEGGRLGEADRARDHRAADAIGEVLAHLVGDVDREPGP